MTLFGFLVLLFIASIIGAIGARLAGARAYGCLTSIVLGLVGALIGNWLSRELQIHDFLYYQSIPIFWSIVGAAIFVAVIGALIGSRSRKG